MTPCRSCKGTEFWRLLGSDGKPLYPEAGWTCFQCHPYGPGVAHAVERRRFEPTGDESR